MGGAIIPRCDIAASSSNVSYPRILCGTLSPHRVEFQPLSPSFVPVDRSSHFHYGHSYRCHERGGEPHAGAPGEDAPVLRCGPGAEDRELYQRHLRQPDAPAEGCSLRQGENSEHALGQPPRAFSMAASAAIQLEMSRNRGDTPGRRLLVPVLLLQSRA